MEGIAESEEANVTAPRLSCSPQRQRLSKAVARVSQAGRAGVVLLDFTGD
jgi:hypothetical protein